MSTRLLSVKGKIHELSDDLESHFFVLLFEGLHFVEHNKPDGISMQRIFDQVDVNLETGNHTGGDGKVALYSSAGFDTMDNQLKFTSKPFTILIRGLYQLFMSLHLYHLLKGIKQKPGRSNERNVKKLEACVGVVALLDEALTSKEWPTKCDKVPDQYPPTNRLKPEQKDTVALSYLNQSLATGSSGGKRKREGPRRSTRKRSKAGPH